VKVGSKVLKASSSVLADETTKLIVDIILYFNNKYQT
jgi:hypothetical protein